MNKIILGVLVGAAVAGLVFYFYDPELFMDTVDDVKDKGKDLVDKAKKGFRKAENDVRNEYGA